MCSRQLAVSGVQIQAIHEAHCELVEKSRRVCMDTRWANINTTHVQVHGCVCAHFGSSLCMWFIACMKGCFFRKRASCPGFYRLLLLLCMDRAPSERTRKLMKRCRPLVRAHSCVFVGVRSQSIFIDALLFQSRLVGFGLSVVSVG